MPTDDNIDILLVSFTPKEDPDDELLIIGRQIGLTNNLDIVNVFQGVKARNIYQKLITKENHE